MARRALALALLVAALNAAAAEEPLGTLFLTAQERAHLDALRRGDPPEQQPGEPRPRRDHALTGFVQRSDGRATVWIDGRAVTLPARRAPVLDPRLVQDDGRGGNPVRVEPAETH